MPTQEQVRLAAEVLIKEAVTPLQKPDLRNLLIELHKKTEQTIDHVSQDKVIEAGFSAEALERAKRVVESRLRSSSRTIRTNDGPSEFYSRPYKAPFRSKDIQELAQAIEKPPYLWTGSPTLAGHAPLLDKSRVKTTGGRRMPDRPGFPGAFCHASG